MTFSWRAVALRPTSPLSVSWCWASCASLSHPWASWSHMSVLFELPNISHEYYDPAEFMESGPQEADLKDKLEYKEVELWKNSHEDKLGLMVCYLIDEEKDLGIYVGEVNPNSIAAKDGRIREGDRIIQISGMHAQNREEAVAILCQDNTNISLLVAWPESQIAKRWKDSDRDDFLNDFGSENEGDLGAWKLESPPAQQTGNDEKWAPDGGPGLSNSQDLDSQVDWTDENTRNEENSEHDLLGDEPPSTTNTPGSLCKFGPQGHALLSRDFHFSMGSLLAEEAGLAGADLPGLTMRSMNVTRSCWRSSTTWKMATSRPSSSPGPPVATMP